MRIIMNRNNFEDLLRQIRDANAGYDIPLITRAYEMAEQAHEGVPRASGEPYICHPVCVAGILVDLGMDTDSIAAALLHDVVEDTDFEIKDIKKRFGQDIALLVDGVTKLGKIPFVSREEEQAENLRKMLMAMDEDIRVIIIKLADRLHNMNTLDALPEQKQRDKSLETLEVYAPIAHRLGIRALKEELEDLAIKHLDDIAYKEIEDALALQSEAREKFLVGIKTRVKNALAGILPDAYIEGRVKSVHGIYRKMYMQGRDFEEIYDIYAVRLIVDNVLECYHALGLIYEMFRPIPGRFKDYISMPKPNKYQSLHTTVIAREGIPFEFQIRTWEMHQTAEYGIAAHWKYKLGLGRDKDENRLNWIRQLLETQKDSDDVEEIVRTIKSDLAPEEVYAVTPKGDVISLPSGSTMIDFGYAIHSAVGNRMTGAKVHGRIVPIDSLVKTGDVIEILTMQGHGPSRDWLKIVRTSEARSKIRAWFKKERRPENILHGKAELEKELHRNRIQLPSDKLKELLLEVSKRQNCNTAEDLYAMLGYGGLNVSSVIPKIRDEYAKIVKTTEPDEISARLKPRVTKSREGVVVEGIDNCLVKLSRCCNPLPGDTIIGFITRGHGVSIHKGDCNNVPLEVEKSEDPGRWVRAHWEGAVKSTFKSSLQILAVDRNSLLADITANLAGMRVMMHAVNAREIKNGNCKINITFSIESLEHLQYVIAKMKSVDGVISVDRATE